MTKQEFDELFRYISGGKDGIDHIVQDPKELWQLIQRVEALNPARSLEIGAAHGGVTSFIHKVSGQVVAVDGNIHNVHFGDYAGGNPEPILIGGDSTAPETIEAVREFAPYDFCFIDGGHDYPIVRADWDNYSPMVRAGGLIGFHDVGSTGGGPHRVLAEIRGSGLSCTVFSGRMGTGLVQK